MSYKALLNTALFPLVLVLTLALAVPAHAEPEDDDDNPGTDTWALHVGVAAVTQPEFIGADENQFNMLPFIRAYYRFDENNEFYLSGNKGGYNHRFDKHWKVGIGLTGTQGRNSDNDSRLAGMPDIGTAIEIGPWVQYRFNDTKLRALLRYDISGQHDGQSIDFQVKQKVRLKPGIHFNAYADTSWADADYMDTFFTVTPGQAVAGRPAYNASSGFYKANLGASFNYGLRKDVFIVVDGKVQRLLGDAADSPVTYSNTNFIGYIGLGYTF